MGEPLVSMRKTWSGGPGDQRPWRVRGASTRTRARKGHHKRTEARKVSGSERQAKRPETGRVAVGAAQSTVEGGAVRPKRPTGGKAPSSSASAGRRQGRDFELTNPDHGRPVDCGARVSLHGQQPLCLRNRMRALRTYGSVGGPGGQPPALPGRRRRIADARASLRLLAASDARR